MQELQFLSSECHLMLIDIYMKFYEDILMVFTFQSGHDFVMHKIPREITKKTIKAEVMVLTLCYLSNLD